MAVSGIRNWFTYVNDSTPHCCDSPPDILRRPRFSAPAEQNTFGRKPFPLQRRPGRDLHRTDVFRASTIASKTSSETIVMRLCCDGSTSWLSCQYFLPVKIVFSVDFERFVRDCQRIGWKRKGILVKVLPGKEKSHALKKVLAFWKWCSYNKCQIKARIFFMNHNSITTAFSFCFCGRFIDGGYFCRVE